MIAVIGKGEDGRFAIRGEGVLEVYGYGNTEQEAKSMLVDVLRNQLGETLDIEYRYDIQGFFLAFPFFNVSKLAEAIGINPSLMRKYKEGHATASRKQREMIQERLQELVASLARVRL